MRPGLTSAIRVANLSLDSLSRATNAAATQANQALQGSAALARASSQTPQAANAPFWIYLGERARRTGRLIENRFGTELPRLGSVVSSSTTVVKRNAMVKNEDGQPVYGQIVGSVAPGARLRVVSVDSIRVLWPNELPEPSDFRFWAQVVVQP
jgi:hypothetical protein